MTEVALRFEEVPDDLPLVIAVGNAERDLRKKALRAGSTDKLKLGSRQFQQGTAHPVQLHASIVEVPGAGEFALLDAGSLWHFEMGAHTYEQHVARFAAACRRASSVLFDWIDSVDDARSAAGMAAAFGVKRSAIWIDHLPLDPPQEERQATVIETAREFFSKPQARTGDLREVADCQCGDTSCETCGPWLELIAYATEPRDVPASDFRIFVDDITGWGVKPHTRIVRGVQRGEVAEGDEIEVRAGRDRYVTMVEEVARGGVVFTLRELRDDEIDAIARPGTLESRDVVAARATGDPDGTSGQAFIDGSHVGKVTVGTVGKKKILRFARAVPFRRGDVVSIFREKTPKRPMVADSYTILDD